jgi:hypothetical protein
MSGPEHYAEAEWMLNAITEPHPSTPGHRPLSADIDPDVIAVAQVHATLALAASAPLADIVGILTEIRDEIARLPSSGRPA